MAIFARLSFFWLFLIFQNFYNDYCVQFLFLSIGTGIKKKLMFESQLNTNTDLLSVIGKPTETAFRLTYLYSSPKLMFK